MKVLHVVTAAALAGAAAVFYATAFHPVLEERSRLAAQLDELEKTNAVLQARLAELRRRQADFRTDPDYVELEARRSGLTRADETVFDFSVGGR
ncbi:MAG: septum formation initiator family protein [Kiritimatiellae bacterium]|nr:septum formation initiator family protein [Kiritimatiellia bacterium]